MADPLRPLSARELLDRTFSLYRHHFKLFVGVSIIGPVATFMYRLLYAGGAIAAARSDSRSSTVSMAIGIAIGVTIMLLAGLAISSAATGKAVAAVCLDRNISIAGSYRALKGRNWRIIGIVFSVFMRAFLGGALFIGLGMIALGSAAALGYNSRAEAGAIGMVCGSIAVMAAILALMVIYVRYAVAVQACVVEDISRKLALERSRFLTGGDGGRVVAMYGIFAMFGLVMGFLLEAPTLLLGGQGVAFQISGAVASFVAAALTAPVGTIGMSLVYYDERVRKEAFDRQAMMNALAPPLQANASVV